MPRPGVKVVDGSGVGPGIGPGIGLVTVPGVEPVVEHPHDP